MLKSVWAEIATFLLGSGVALLSLFFCLAVWQNIVVTLLEEEKHDW